MEKWEYRYLHNRAVRNACLACSDISPPKNEKYGELIPLPMRVKMVYNGKKFWKQMETEGHDFAEYSRCSCHKN